MDTLAEQIKTIEMALGHIRMPAVQGEYDLHEDVKQALEQAGVSYVHEAKLGPGCRIDFLCGSIGIEVKKGKVQSSRLRTQVEKYLAFEEVHAMIVVTGWTADLPGSIAGKPVRVFGVRRLWGVAL